MGAPYPVDVYVAPALETLPPRAEEMQPRLAVEVRHGRLSELVERRRVGGGACWCLLGLGGRDALVVGRTVMIFIVVIGLVVERDTTSIG